MRSILKKIKKRAFLTLIALLVSFLLPILTQAQNKQNQEVFKAEVTEILKQQEINTEQGLKIQQQNIKLKGLEGKWKNKEINFNGIKDFYVLNSPVYQVGDKVLVSAEKDNTGNNVFYIVDYIRTSWIAWLFAIFITTILAIGKWKGLRALISLFFSFIIILKLIVPAILSGNSPLITALFGSFLILGIIIYLTEGWNKKAHLAILSVAVCLLITCLLSIIFSSLTQLTGMSQEETSFLMNVAGKTINFKGLLLASILIGTLGVLDDIVLSQIETVKQIKQTKPQIKTKKLIKIAFKIGNTHLSAIVNTLFLAYTGAALPLLLLFSLKQPPFLSFSQVINNEIVAVEIVRTLIGCIGLALAMPISNILAIVFYQNLFAKSKKNKI